MHNFDISNKILSAVFDTHYYNLLSESVQLLDYYSWLLQLKTSGFDTATMSCGSVCRGWRHL